MPVMTWFERAGAGGREGEPVMSAGQYAILCAQQQGKQHQSATLQNEARQALLCAHLLPCQSPHLMVDHCRCPNVIRVSEAVVSLQSDMSLSLSRLSSGARGCTTAGHVPRFSSVLLSHKIAGSILCCRPIRNVMHTRLRSEGLTCMALDACTTEQEATPITS